MSTRRTRRFPVWIGLIPWLALSPAALPGVAHADPGSPEAAPEAAADAEADGSITVVGRGVVAVRPDLARVSVGVEAVAPTVDAAMQEANTKMTAIVAALAALGISGDDVQTSNLSVRADRPNPGDASTVTQYHVSNTVNAKIHDLSKASAALEATIDAGANQIWGLTFGVADDAPLRARARTLAIEDARTRAETLAAASGVTLGPLISIKESGGGGRAFAAGATRMAEAGPPIEGGQIEISAQVEVVYAIGAVTEEPAVGR